MRLGCGLGGGPAQSSVLWKGLASEGDEMNIGKVSAEVEVLRKWLANE